MGLPRVGEANGASERLADLRYKEEALRFYRRHLPSSRRRVSKVEATLTGWARLVDFAGALSVPQMRLPLLTRQDDFDALATDWKLVGEDTWRGLETALDSLSAEDFDRVMKEVVHLFADVVEKLAPDEEQLRLDLASGTDQTDD
ncbi:MAG TPA: hypothetical protein VGR26_02055 [Acidimicrobiales bacterium]|nr:hypothetical protein [Acidimicrobiales bacterium]